MPSVRIVAFCMNTIKSVCLSVKPSSSLGFARSQTALANMIWKRSRYDTLQGQKSLLAKDFFANFHDFAVEIPST